MNAHWMRSRKRHAKPTPITLLISWKKATIQVKFLPFVLFYMSECLYRNLLCNMFYFLFSYLKHLCRFNLCIMGSFGGLVLSIPLGRYDFIISISQRWVSVAASCPRARSRGSPLLELWSDNHRSSFWMKSPALWTQRVKTR